MDIFELWDKVLAYIDKNDHQFYQMFFNDVFPFSISEDRLILQVANPYRARWINTMYREKLEHIVRDITGKTVTVEINAQPAGPAPAPFTEIEEKEEAPAVSFPPEKEESIPLPEEENGEAPLEPPDWDSLMPKSADEADLPDIMNIRDNEKSSLSDSRPKAEKSTPSYTQTNWVNKEFTFDTFVSTNCNELAYQAAKSVAESATNPNSPDQKLNPLFIYGPSGLGKTHLLHAIYNYVREKRPDMKVLYVTSETFTNELISAIQNRSMPKFREKYRNPDFLLIDDVQFFGSRDSTKMEIFNTFNELFSKKKNIIMTSDRTPSDIEKLEDRLRSRFSSGLVAPISPPDYEMCCIILRKMAEKFHIILPEDVVKYIANHINTNVRELEGSFNRLYNYSHLKERPIDLPFAREALKDQISPDSDRELTVDIIIDTVCRYYNVKKETMLAKGRPKRIVIPRQMAMYICRKELDISFPALRDAFHRKDHSTVLYACERVEKNLENDKQTREDVEAIENLLKKR